MVVWVQVNMALRACVRVFNGCACVLLLLLLLLLHVDSRSHEAGGYDVCKVR